MPVNNTTSTSGGGTVTSFSNTPQAKDDTFNLTEDTVSLVATTDSSTIISLDVMANDGGGAAKSLYSIDDGASPETTTKVKAPIDLTKAEEWDAGLSPWEDIGHGVQIRLNALTGKVEMDLTGYLAANNWSSLQEMGPNDSIHETFTYAIRLANGTLSWATAEVNIVGTNDAADIGGQSSAVLTESDAAQQTGGQLTVTDVDGADAFKPQTDAPGLGGYGTFSIDADGTWTYQMNSAHNEFKAGFDYIDSIVVAAADGTTKTITVTIHGTNDAPVLTGAQATLDDGTEEQQYTISEADLLAGYTDAEGDGLSVTDLTASNGTLIYNGDGTWTFTPNTNFHGTVALNYNVTDGTASVAAQQTFGIVNVEDEATGTVGVTGTAAEGGALTADTSGLSDVDGALTFAYQWQEKVGDAWVNLASQTGGTLNIPSDQSYVGKEVRVVVTTTDPFNGTTTFESASQVIANVEDEATGTVGVTGLAQEGGSLTADTSGLTDPDGAITPAYQWQEKVGDAWVNLASQTGGTLNIPSDQSYVGKEVRVVVTTTDPFSGTTTFESASQVIANVEDEATGTVGVTGLAQEGASLTADTSGLTDPDGAITPAYQWQEKVGDAWVNLASQTGGTLNIPSDQSYVGKEVRVVVTTTDPFSGTTTFESASQVIANVEDEATGTLAIGGTAQEGGTLSANTSGLSDEDGALSFAYQWQLDGVDIDGATGSTLNVPADQSYVGHQVTLKVTSTDPFNGTTAFSASTSIANVNDAPVITGGDTQTFTIDENATAVATLSSSDVDGGPAVWSIVPGQEGALFSINPSTGALAFNSAPDFETPLDSAPTNSYQLTVQVSDGQGGIDTQAITVNVANVTEGPVVAPPYTGDADPNDFDTAGPGTTSSSFNGGDGNDTITGSSAGEHISGGSGADTLYGKDGADSINGGSQDDSIYGQGGADIGLTGNAGADLIYAGSGNDTVDGGSQSDTIYGGSGDDLIVGGSHSDSIIGGYGADSIDLTGGGSDIVVFLSTRDTGDTITGFQVDDRLDFSRIDATNGAVDTSDPSYDPLPNNGSAAFGLHANTDTVFANGLSYFQSGANTVIWGDTDGNVATVEIQVTLLGVTATILGAGNFEL